MCTVKQLIESLQRYEPDDIVEVEIGQSYNKSFPVGYCDIKESVMLEGLFATKRNGVRVRININLPEDEESYTFLSRRKKQINYGTQTRTTLRR